MSTRRLQPSRFGSLRRLSRRSGEARSNVAHGAVGHPIPRAGSSALDREVDAAEPSLRHPIGGEIVRRLIRPSSAPGKLLQEFIAHSASVAQEPEFDEAGRSTPAITVLGPLVGGQLHPYGFSRFPPTLVEFGASIPTLGPREVLTGFASPPAAMAPLHPFAGTPRDSETAGCRRRVPAELVEETGIEPATSRLQSVRSPG